MGSWPIWPKGPKGLWDRSKRGLISMAYTGITKPVLARASQRASDPPKGLKYPYFDPFWGSWALWAIWAPLGQAGPVIPCESP